MHKTALITQLARGTVEERMRAADELAEHRGHAVVAALVAALKDRSYRVRWSAVDALGALGGPEAAAAIVGALDDRDSDVQMRAIENLGDLGGEIAVEPLIRLLRDTANPLLRVCIVDSMWGVADPRFTASLRECLTDEDDLVRGHAASALGKIGTAEAIPDLESALRWETSSQGKLGLHEALFQLGRHGSLEAIAELLADEDYRVRCACANTLGEIASDDHRDLVIEVLSRALAREETVAARSSIERNLAALRSPAGG